MSEVNSKSEMRRLDIMKDAEIERLRALVKDHSDDWKRIQDAERKCEKLHVALKEIKREESNSQRPGRSPSRSFQIADKALKGNKDE